MSSAAIEVSADGFAGAAPREVWRVLTDYERLPEFVPDLESSQVIGRNGCEVMLRQHAESGVLFARQRIELVLRVLEQPYSAIDVSYVSGNMQRYDAHWRLQAGEEAGQAGTRIGYRASLRPDFFVPPLAGPALAQASVERMLQALLREIGRRAAG